MNCVIYLETGDSFTRLADEQSFGGLILELAPSRAAKTQDRSGSLVKKLREVLQHPSSTNIKLFRTRPRRSLLPSLTERS